MNMYSKAKIEEFVEKVKDTAQSVDVGMYEDFFWTAETVWSKENGWMDGWNEIEGDEVCLAGIKGSKWARPYARAKFFTPVPLDGFVGIEKD